MVYELRKVGTRRPRRMGPCFRRDDKHFSITRIEDLNLSPRRTALHRGLEFLAEFGKFVGGEVADRPVVQPAVAPASDVESLKRFGRGRAVLGAGGLGDEQIDDMQPATVNNGADRAGVDIIEAAADQRKTLGGQIDHRWCYVKPAVEPRLHCVLVGRKHIGEMPGLQRAQMSRYDLGFNPRFVVATQHDGDDAARRNRRYGRSHRKAPQYRAPVWHSRFRQCRLDAPTQRSWRLVTQIRTGDRLAHLAIGGELFGAAWAGCNMVFDLARVPGVEFAVNQRVDQNVGLVASHLGCSCSASHAERSMARARARRDITVPTGTSATSAISRYERLWISRSIKVSRNGSASAVSSRLMVLASDRCIICASAVSSASFHKGVCSD